MNRKLLFSLFMLTGLIRIEAQITTTRPLTSGVKTTVASSNTAIAGNWTGTQTNDYGLYPQAINFQLTSAGEFRMGQAAKGTYTFSNNSINGSYKLMGSGEVISFTGSYDPTTQKLNCTLGSGTKTTGQGKWVVTKNAATQIQPVTPTIVYKTNTSTLPAPPPTTNSSQFTSNNTINAYDYYLTNVTVKVHTGTDNKEALSGVQAHLYNPASTEYSKEPSLELLFSTVGGPVQNDYKNEFKSNSVNAITLYTPYSTGFDGRPRYREFSINLGLLLRTGLQLNLDYFPNIFTDAWKVEKVEIQFEFRNAKGEPHPTYSKTILYPIVSKLLTSGNYSLRLKTDNFLMPVY
jgi:hypothetical protein